MKKLYIILGIVAGIYLGVATSTQAATYLFPYQGGTGTSTAPTYGQLLVGNAGGTYTLTATSSLGISSSSSSGTVSTSTVPTVGNLSYWTSAAYPSLLGSVATTSLTGNNGLTLSAGAGALVGGSNATIGLATIAANSVLANQTSGVAVPTALATSTLFQNLVPYTGATANVNLNGFSLLAHSFLGDATDGALIEANNGNDVAVFGVANSQNALFYGGVNIDGATRLATSLTGLLKATSGAVTAATAGSDYENPLTFSFPLIRTTNAISWGGLATTSNPTAGNIFYSNGTNGLIPIATSSINVGTASALFANGANCSAGNYPLGVDASGAVEDCTAAGSGTFSWTPTTYSGVAVNATSTALWLKATSPFSLIASSTYSTFSSTTMLTVDDGLAGDAVTQYGAASHEWVVGYDATDFSFAIASSTTLGSSNALTINKSLGVTLGGALVVTGQTTLATSLTGVGVLTSGVVSAVGAQTCTNQFVRAMSAAYVATCATVSLTADVTGDLPFANLAQVAANSVLGNITGSTADAASVATSSLFTWTGTGNVVRSTSPTLVTPALGTPSALVLTNATGLPVAGGGTGVSTFTASQLLYGNGTNALTSVATSSLAVGASITSSGTLGAQVGGTASSLSLNMGNANTWTALQTFANASSTQFSAASETFYIDSTGKVLAKDTTNNWSGRLSPTKGHTFNIATSTGTWTATSTSGVDISPERTMRYAGTLRSVSCEVNTFLGIRIEINGTPVVPSYFVASTTNGVVSFTSANTFSVGAVITVYAGTTTSATAASGVVRGSCTIDATET